MCVCVCLSPKCSLTSSPLNQDVDLSSPLLIFTPRSLLSAGLHEPRRLRPLSHPHPCPSALGSFLQSLSLTCPQVQMTLPMRISPSKPSTSQRAVIHHPRIRVSSRPLAHITQPWEGPTGGTRGRVWRPGPMVWGVVASRLVCDSGGGVALRRW